MKSAKFFSFFLLGTLLFADCTDAFSWGQKGHDITCAIARRHLNGRARKRVAEILDGKSIVYWANWLDNASHTPEYSYTKTWHYLNIDEGQTFQTAPRNPDGDVVSAIEAQIAAIKSRELNKEAEAVALRMLVHLVGDMHCPMHVSHASDVGGNRWQVQYFGKGSNLHKVWDSGIIESAHRWTYSEWADEIDNLPAAKADELLRGGVVDWVVETFSVSQKIYEATPVGSKLSYDYVADWSGVVEDQLLKGGLRLAYILNSIL